MHDIELFELYATIGIKMDEFERGLNSAQSKFNSFANNIKSVSGDISGVSSSISKAYSNVGDLLEPAVKGFQTVESVGKKAGNGITSAMKGFLAASAAVGGFSAAAVKSGMNFDATMSKVSAISGATGKDFESLRDKALEMGAKTKFSASEAAEA